MKNICENIDVKTFFVDVVWWLYGDWINDNWLMNTIFILMSDYWNDPQLKADSVFKLIYAVQILL